MTLIRNGLALVLGALLGTGLVATIGLLVSGEITSRQPSGTLVVMLPLLVCVLLHLFMHAGPDAVGSRERVGRIPAGNLHHR
ncbi:hypothetical protein [Rhodoplanes azumiensis]|uniref:Uncharacterized protein n=1 Tax=Rhodoplanes azumiensis TaxID=1897628 RepID=A0ABW5AFN4_9BRAD